MNTYDPKNYRVATLQEIAQRTELSEKEVTEIIDRYKNVSLVALPDGKPGKVMLLYSFGIKKEASNAF